MTTTIDYSPYCAYRLPCGFCTRTNSYCQLFFNSIEVTWAAGTTTSITVDTVAEGKEE